MDAAHQVSGMAKLESTMRAREFRNANTAVGGIRTRQVRHPYKSQAEDMDSLVGKFCEFESALVPEFRDRNCARSPDKIKRKFTKKNAIEEALNNRPMTDCLTRILKSGPGRAKIGSGTMAHLCK